MLLLPWMKPNIIYMHNNMNVNTYKAIAILKLKKEEDLPLVTS